MKSGIILLVICTGIALSLNGCSHMAKKHLKTSSETRQVDVNGKKKVILDNVRGTIILTQGTDSGMMTIKSTKEVRVKKKFINTPFDEIEINVDTNTNVINIKSEISDDGRDGIFRFNNGKQARVDFELIVPPGLDVEINNSSGNITADNIECNLKIDLINGEVDLENFTGRLDCEITNGSFSGEIDSTTGINISTINGNVMLRLKNYIDANLKAETVHGKITDENLELTLTDKEKGLLKGKLGMGNPRVGINIDTVNGKIWLVGSGRNEI